MQNTRVFANSVFANSVLRKKPRFLHLVSAMESCVLCGVGLCKSDNKRRKRARDIKDMLENNWKETGFVWKIVNEFCKGMSDNEATSICMPCIHWMVRCRAHAKDQKVFLILDHLLVFLHFPFKSENLDSRLIRRMVSNLNWEHNGSWNRYLLLVPEYARGLIAEYSRKKFSYKKFTLQVGRLYFTRYGKQSLFGNNEETFRLRRNLKEDIDEEQRFLLEF